MIATIPRIQTIFNRPAAQTTGGSPKSGVSPVARTMEFEGFGSMWTGGPPSRPNVYSQFSASDSDALHAAIYGYGGHGAIMAAGPGAVLPSRFWDESTIDEVVTKDYIKNQFSGSLRKKLEEAIDSGEDLTEATYIEWIHEKMRRMFLILLDIGCKEKIFDMVLGSWDDSDLPLSTQTIARLDFAASREKQFYKKQYEVLVKCLEKGDYIEYYEDEVVPIEVVEKKPAQTNAGLIIDKVICKKNRTTFIRLRMPIPKIEKKRESEDSIGDMVTKSTTLEDPVLKKAFLDELEFRKGLDHQHIQSVFAAYTHQEFGYMLLTPMTEITLKQFIQSPPLSYKTMEKKERRNTIIRWFHCMISALNYLHSKGVSHYNITPRTVMITADNEIVLVDVHLNSTPRSASPSADLEGYEYGAPEQWIRTLASHDSSTSIPSSNGARSHKVESGASSTTSTSPPSSFNVSSWTQQGMSHQTTNKPAIFSLGAVFLDLLTFALKRKPSAFSAHRSAKNHRPRVSGRPDASFHSNISQVESWIDLLEKDAKKKTWCAAREALATVRYMLVKDPIERVAGKEVERQIYRIVELEQIQACPCSAGEVTHGMPVSAARPGLDRRDTFKSTKSNATSSSGTPSLKAGWEHESAERNASERIGWVEGHNLSDRSSRGTHLSTSTRSSRVGWAI